MKKTINKRMNRKSILRQNKRKNTRSTITKMFRKHT